MCISIYNPLFCFVSQVELARDTAEASFVERDALIRLLLTSAPMYRN